MNKKLKILGFILALPLILGSCAKNYTRSALGKAVDGASKVNGDTELNYYINNPSEYMVLAQVYSPDITNGQGTLYGYLRAKEGIDAAAVWIDARENLQSLYIAFVINKKDNITAELHLSANGHFIVFKGSLKTKFVEGSKIEFFGRDSQGTALLTARSIGSRLSNVSTVIDGSAPFTDGTTRLDLAN